MNPTKMYKPRVLVIVPCFNEAGSIRVVLEELAREAPDYDVLVIDDGSSDDTAEIARETVSCIRLPINLGIGGAVQTGIKYAYRNGYDCCIQVDGDGQHPPTEIPSLVAALTREKAQLLIGTRYMGPSEGFQSSLLRRIGSRIIGVAIALCFGGRRITDPTSGFRIMDRQAMRIFAESYPRDYPEPISIAWSLARSMNISETSVKMRERQAGKSSIRAMKTASYMIRVVTYVMLSRFTILSTDD
jgi:glycosyltransferase involved in cell wall biosynthesis